MVSKYTQLCGLRNVWEGNINDIHGGRGDEGGSLAAALQTSESSLQEDFEEAGAADWVEVIPYRVLINSVTAGINSNL